MWPTILEVDTAVGSQPVNTYGLFIVAAFSAAFLFIHFRAQRAGINPDRLIGGYLSAAVGGMLGGRLLYAVSVDWQQTISNPLSLLSCSGFAVYGGIIGGTLGVVAFCLANGLPVWKMSDLAAPGVLIGMGVGRFGCFFAGCCHGAVAPVGEHPVGLLPAWFTGGQMWLSGVLPFLTLEFHGGVGRFHDVPLYPTQLWSAFYLLGLAALLAWSWKRRRFDGQIAAMTLMIEPWFRSFVESFRSDQRGYAMSWEVSPDVAAALPGMAEAGAEVTANVIGITTSQGIGIGLVLLGVVVWLLRRKSGLDAAKAIDAGEGDLLEELA